MGVFFWRGGLAVPMHGWRLSRAVHGTSGLRPACHHQYVRHRNLYIVNAAADSAMASGVHLHRLPDGRFCHPSVVVGIAVAAEAGPMDETSGPASRVAVEPVTYRQMASGRARRWICRGPGRSLSAWRFPVATEC